MPSMTYIYHTAEGTTKPAMLYIFTYTRHTVAILAAIQCMYIVNWSTKFIAADY
jgi:hypothetical protein